MAETRQITVKAAICVPRVPNFLIMEDGQKLPLSAVDEEGLRAIGAAWTIDLIARAKEQRAGKAVGGS